MKPDHTEVKPDSADVIPGPADVIPGHAEVKSDIAEPGTTSEEPKETGIQGESVGRGSGHNTGLKALSVNADPGVDADPPEVTQDEPADTRPGVDADPDETRPGVDADPAELERLILLKKDMLTMLKLSLLTVRSCLPPPSRKYSHFGQSDIH